MKNDKENLNQSINSNRRKLLGLAGVAGAGALLSPLFVKAAPSTIIEAGSGVDTASCIIFKDGNTIYAKNGTTGKIDFQGTDASTVIQDTINIMNEGQTLFIRNGIYDLTTAALNVTRGINIIGEAAVTTGVSSNGTLYGSVLRRSGNVLSVNMQTKASFNVVIKNIALDGMDQSASGLLLKYFHGTIDSVLIKNCNIGLDVQYGWTSDYYSIHAFKCNIGGQISAPSVSQSNFYACTFNYNNDTGFVKSSGSAVNFIGCDFEWNGKYGLVIKGANCNVDGCYFESNPLYRVANQNYGAHVKIGEDTVYSADIRLANCYFGSQDKNINITDAYRIWIRHGYIILIENCYFYQPSGETVRTDIKNDEGLNADILLINCRYVHDGEWTRENFSGIKTINTRDWKTSNSGILTTNGTGAQTDFDITHGLAADPTTFELTAKHRDSAGDKYWVKKDVNTVTVKFVTPPPAGTNNVVLSWRAEV